MKGAPSLTLTLVSDIRRLFEPHTSPEVGNGESRGFFEQVPPLFQFLPLGRGHFVKKLALAPNPTGTFQRLGRLVPAQASFSAQEAPQTARPTHRVSKK